MVRVEVQLDGCDTFSRPEVLIMLSTARRNQSTTRLTPRCITSRITRQALDAEADARIEERFNPRHITANNSYYQTVARMMVTNLVMAIEKDY